jgi:tetratricopeptide (TPR) repeat protein
MILEQTLQTAITHHKAGELENAEQLYRSILSEQTNHPDANHNLGVLLKQYDKADSALPFFKRALESNSNQGQFWISYIDTLIHLGQYDAAQNVLNEGQAKGLKGDAVDQLKERLALQKGQGNKKMSSGPPQAKIDAVISLYSRGQLQEALSALEAMIKNYPNTPLLYNISGACHKALGQLDAAVKSYEKALAIKPDYAEAHYNLGNTLNDLGQLEAAVKRYEQALAIKPDYAEAHYNLGITLQELGQLDAAVKSYEKALAIKPDYAEAHYNLGITLQALGQLDAAVKSYEKTLAIKPSYAEAHNNLGATLKELGQLDAAVKSYEQVLAIKPDYAEAHNNLGNTLKELGQLEAAIKSFEQALAIKPDYAEAWGNVFFTAKALGVSTAQNTWLASYKKKLDEDVLDGVHFKILEYRLNAFTPHTVDDCFNDAINALPLKTTEEIQNPSPIHKNEKPVLISDNMIALTHFGRSGTGLLHSLIDNHPEISTLPSIYFSEYYNADVWGKLIAQGWDQLPENFIKQFAVLFDARSSVPVPSIDKPLANLGQKEGMANVGVNQDEVLTVDQNLFCAELRKLMAYYTSLTPQTFFGLVHNTYEKALNKSANKQTIFYHIHNPSPYAKLNFLRYNPEARLLIMVREPVQSCESWVKKVIKESSESLHSYIVTMLFDIDQIAFRRQDSIGVRLEDLKEQPEATMTALCNWMGIEDSPTLYEMTAQGKKWWGDPSSPDYSPEGMSPFDDSAITRKVGSVFSEQDQFILRTLFYPFNVRFDYVEENLIGFKEDLKAIKPLLDEPFGFQEKLAENLNQDLEAITRSGSALYLRAALHDRWAVLNEFNDYPNMLKPLVIKRS